MINHKALPNLPVAIPLAIMILQPKYSQNISGSEVNNVFGIEDPPREALKMNSHAKGIYYLA
jgi:hypothetical protein